MSIKNSSVFCLNILYISTVLLISHSETAAEVPHILCTPPARQYLRQAVTAFSGQEYLEVISVSSQHNQRIVHFFAAGTGDMVVHGGPPDIFDRKALKKAYPDLSGRLPQFRIADYVVGVVVNSSVLVQSLNVDQLGQICTGRITNWKQVGGPDRRIVLIGKDLSSNAGTILRETCFDNKQFRSDLIKKTGKSQQAILAEVKKHSGGIGFFLHESPGNNSDINKFKGVRLLQIAPCEILKDFPAVIFQLNQIYAKKCVKLVSG